MDIRCVKPLVWVWAGAVFLQVPIASDSNPDQFLEHEFISNTSEILDGLVRTVADDIYSFRDIMQHSGFLKDSMKWIHMFGQLSGDIKSGAHPL